jgi:diamine N-acetyltransferase
MADRQPHRPPTIARNATDDGLVDVADLQWVELPPVDVDWQREPQNDAAAFAPAPDLLLRGLRVGLRRAAAEDAPRAWRWLAQSDLTPRRLGPPLFPDHPPPSYAAFCNDFAPHFFDGSLPYEGRGFVIRGLREGRDVGFIAHDRLDVLNDVACLDLWLADGAVAGRGYGSEAIDLLCRWLQSERGINRFLLRPSRRNVRALRAMRRAGFRETDLPATQVLDKLALPRGEYADEVLLFRFQPLPAQRLAPAPDRCHVYVDSEFTRLVQPQLLSLGAVADDGTHFYAEIADALDDAAGGPLRERCSEFVRDVVLPLLDGGAQPRAAVAQQFADWLTQRGRHGPVTVVTDSGFDRWALSELLQREDLPEGVRWLRVPIAYETLDETGARLGLRRHHALDDARALRAAVVDGE